MDILEKELGVLNSASIEYIGMNWVRRLRRDTLKMDYKFRKSNYLWFGLGFIGILIYYLPYFILGQDAAFRISDYLDDEVVQLLFNGKYLFASSKTIVEEWLSGVPFATIQAPCFTLIFFFKVFSFYHAIVLIGLFGMMIAYIGMYLLSNKLLRGNQCYISFMAALLYAMLPYYPSYGLSSVGLPLVVWACWNLCEDKGERRYSYLPYYLTLLFYALSSSVIWAGYFVVGFVFVTAVLMLVKKQKGGTRLLLSGVLMTVVYCYVFRATIASVLFGTFTSHRADEAKVYVAEDFVANFVEMFKYGQYHVPSFHTYIMAFSLCVIVLGWFLYKRLEKSNCYKLWLASGIWGVAVWIAVFYAFYNSQMGLALRAHLGGLESFQLDRVYWAYPMLWYTQLAVCTSLFFEIVEVIVEWFLAVIPRLEQLLSTKIRVTLLKLVRALFVIAATVFMANYIIHHPNNVEYYSNIQRLCKQETNQISYRGFYDHELFDRLKDYIGKEQSEYRVGCIGFVPAIVSVNGFYTVDGYSTNYPVEYKREFREIIAKELEKNAAIKQYFDDWGSRCYLFVAELGMDYDHRKYENITIQNLQINTEKLKELGCEYIFSAVEVMNASDLDMDLLEVFEGEEIEIYLYEL